MSAIDFDIFYKNMGFSSYPFRDRTAEKENTKLLFIKPIDYSMFVDVFNASQTCIINGNRGTGKTIIEKDLETKLEANSLTCTITNYETVALENNILDYYSLILQKITQSLLVYLFKNKKTFKKLTNDERILISFLIMKYGDSITDSQLKHQIENIQLSMWQRIVNKFSKPITSILNYGATALTNFGNHFLTQHFGAYLPSIDESQVKEIFPEIKFRTENDFKSVEISYSLLCKSLETINNIIGKPPIVFMDKFDEDIRIENDAEVLAIFTKELLCDNNLLLNPNIQIIVSMWKISFSQLETSFRRSKHYVYDITWNRQQLENVLNQRISVFSNNTQKNYRSLFTNATEEDFENIFELCNSNPRDLWDIFDKLFHAQFELDSSCTSISHEAIVNGLQCFVENFSFYEYYPRKKNARKNTNDIYSYIKHLLTLNNTIEFTNDELRTSAATGGSTTNYITGMMNIGLVSKTDAKRPGGSIIYKINDPKVQYAINNKIEIQHS